MLAALSLSARRAWIEIVRGVSFLRKITSLSARRAWIEIAQDRRVPGRSLSLSARRAWIEIAAIRLSVLAYYVALRKESVDRNTPEEVPTNEEQTVALRKESVDRNNRIAKPFREQFSRSPQGERG